MKQKASIPSFEEFFNQDWHCTRCTRNLMVENDDEAAYKGSGTQSKSPIVYDYDDWKFLTQFPTWLWKKAIQWRYNTGLLMATKMRQENDNSDDSMPEYLPQVVFYDDNGKKYIFDAQSEKRRGIYVGLKNLVKKLEKPLKVKKDQGPEHHPDFVKDEPGIQDVHPDVEDTDNPAHPSNYHYGLHDYDLLSPVEIHPDVIEDLKPEELPDSDLPKTEEGKKKLMENPPHTWAGMRALQHQVASNSLNAWWKAQALGLLGDVGDKVRDPITGQEHEVKYGNPSSLSRPPGRGTDPYWSDTLGRDDKAKWEEADWKGRVTYRHESPGPVQLQLPFYIQHMNYRTIEPGSNKSEMVRGFVYTPILKPGKLLPLHIHASGSQRDAFARRKMDNEIKRKELLVKQLRETIDQVNLLRETPADELAKSKRTRNLIDKLDKLIPVLQEKIADIEEKIKNPDPKAGQVGDLANLLNNWDLLSPSQQRHLKVNQRDLLHFAKKQNDRTYTDKFSGSGRHYIIGFHPMRHQPGTTPYYNLSKEQINQAIAEYYPADSKKLYGGLIGEARRGVERFLQNRLGWKPDAPGEMGEVKARQDDFTEDERKLVLDMMLAFKDEIEQTAAVILGLNLNHPVRGVCDAKLGLTVNCHQKDDDGDEDEELGRPKKKSLDHVRMAHLARIQYAYDFAWSISQAALSDAAGSRREREKRQRYGVTGPLPVKKDAMTNRTGVMENPKVWYKTRQKNVARTQWINELFNSIRQQILKQGGADHLGPLDDLEENAVKVLDMANNLYNNRKDELLKTNLSPEEAEKKAKKEAGEALTPMLKLGHPEVIEKRPKPVVAPVVDKPVVQPPAELSLQQMLDDLPNYYNKVLDHPEIHNNKLALRAAFDRLLAELERKRQTRTRPSSKEMLAYSRIKGSDLIR